MIHARLGRACVLQLGAAEAGADEHRVRRAAKLGMTILRSCGAFSSFPWPAEREASLAARRLPAACSCSTSAMTDRASDDENSRGSETSLRWVFLLGVMHHLFRLLACRASAICGAGFG